MRDPFSERTAAIGCGPVEFDVEYADRHGWPRWASRMAWAALRTVARTGGALARFLHPEWYIREAGGEVAFIRPHDPEPPCG